MAVEIDVHLARVREAAFLTGLAMRAKAHWGYDDAFLSQCREELTVWADDIEAGVVWVAVVDGRVVGILDVRVAQPQSELHMIFVEPDVIGDGVGRRLWEKAEELARAAGSQEIGVDSDPYAEGFYQSMGAVKVGEVPSGSIPGRVLPRLVKRLEA